MKRSLSCMTGLLLLLLAAGSASAGKIDDDFKAEFERAFEARRTFAVVMQPGLPTTSTFGKDGNSTTAYYSIDIVEGDWKDSEGLLDLNQVEVDRLRLGEAVEIVDVTYKNNRVDIRTVSLEMHKVKRGSWLLSDTKPEPCSTNFKFSLPFPKDMPLTAREVPDALAYIEEYLRPFPHEEEARVFGARVTLEEASASRHGRRRAPAPERADAKLGLRVGMTPLDVLDVLGRPLEEVVIDNEIRWRYPDLTVVFENGRVK